jgi:hypothetical protein
MIIDILSDLHINAHLKYLNPSDKLVERLWKHLKPKGEILIVAGDMGEITQQNVNFLSALKRLFYKEIICVLGNHDLYGLYNRIIYLYDENLEIAEQRGWDNYTIKREEAKKLYMDAGIHLLDGTTVTINGITFGGAMGWYDGLYPIRHGISLGKHPMFRYREYDDLQELWTTCMPDHDIKPMRRFNELLKEELPKIEAVIDRCDIMITHINPSIDKAHQNPDWKDHPTCGFYSFDGTDLIKKFRGSHWIFGHSHYNEEYRIDTFNFIANTLGYPSEHIKDTRILTIEVSQ